MKKNNYKLTIGAYFYNDFNEKYDFFINELLKIKHDDVELLIINNGGDHFNIKDKINNIDVRCINLEKNIKPGGAKRKIIEQANGAYIWIVDSDDKFTVGDIDKIINNNEDYYSIYGFDIAFTFSYIFKKDFAIKNKLLDGWFQWWEEVDFSRVFQKGKLAPGFKYEKIESDNFSISRRLSELESISWILKNNKCHMSKFEDSFFSEEIKKLTVDYCWRSKMKSSEYISLNKKGILNMNWLTLALYKTRIIVPFFWMARTFVKIFKRQ